MPKLAFRMNNYFYNIILCLYWPSVFSDHRYNSYPRQNKTVLLQMADIHTGLSPQLDGFEINDEIEDIESFLSC